MHSGAHSRQVKLPSLVQSSFIYFYNYLDIIKHKVSYCLFLKLKLYFMGKYNRLSLNSCLLNTWLNEYLFILSWILFLKFSKWIWYYCETKSTSLLQKWDIISLRRKHYQASFYLPLFRFWLSWFFFLLKLCLIWLDLI